MINSLHKIKCHRLGSPGNKYLGGIKGAKSLLENKLTRKEKEKNQN